VRYSYHRPHILLLRNNCSVSCERTYRLYRDEGLSIRPHAPERKRTWYYRQGRLEMGGPSEVCAANFMAG
jgi:putative transposase